MVPFRLGLINKETRLPRFHFVTFVYVNSPTTIIGRKGYALAPTKSSRRAKKLTVSSTDYTEIGSMTLNGDKIRATDGVAIPRIKNQYYEEPREHVIRGIATPSVGVS